MHILLEHTEKIWIFMKVAECGSLTKAAEELHLAQPTVSYALKTLEAQLGTELVVRSSKGISLNASGRLLMQEMTRIKQLLTETEELLTKNKLCRVPSKLTIGTYESIAVYLWPKLTQSLKALYPEMELSLVTRRSAEVMQDVASGKVDGGLVVGPIIHPSLNKMLLYFDDYSFFVGSDVDLSSSSLPVITVPDACDSKSCTLFQWISQSSFSNRPLLSLSSFEVCAEFASKGMGVTIIPNRVNAHQMELGRNLKRLPENGLRQANFGKHDFYFCYRSSSPQIDLFKENFGRLIKDINDGTKSS
jgi:DNA-binding transcriptional LysR family regulator